MALRQILVGAAAVAAVTLTTGATVPRPEGAEPLRYRDQVFSAVTKTPDLQYGTAPGKQGQPEALRLDMYQPAGDTRSGRPALVWVHGGGFTAGDKTNYVPVDVAETLARQGYVVVSVNYRLLGEDSCVGNPTQAVCTNAAAAAQHDAQAAVRWLRANAGAHRLDPTRIAVGGESAGGITATLVGLQPESPGDSGSPGFSSAVRGFVSVSGGLPDGLYADSAGDAPGLLFHGSADTIVSPAWSTATAGRMAQNGVFASLQIQDGAGHVPWYGSYRSLYLEQTTNFLYTVLGLAPAPAGPPPDTTRPSLGRLAFSSTTFRAARTGRATAAATRRRARLTTRVAYRVSEAGTARFSVDRAVKGRRSGGKCVARTRRNRTRRACNRWAKAKGAIVLKARKGRNSFRFRGRVGRRTLRPGKYRLNTRATDRAGNRSGLRRKTFKIVR